MISVEEERENLVRQIKGLDARLESLHKSLKFQRASIPNKPDPTSTKSQHGGLKREVLDLMVKAGPSGITVKEISSYLNTKPANIHAWFHSTGKKISQISKIGEARYALTGELPPEPEPKVKPKARANTAPTQPRGGLTRKLFAVMETAGPEGVSIKSLAEKVESNYRNIAVWFATTAKKFSNIEKVAPAVYRLNPVAPAPAPAPVTEAEPQPEAPSEPVPATF